VFLEPPLHITTTITTTTTIICPDSHPRWLLHRHHLHVKPTLWLICSRCWIASQTSRSII
jgi:hypothetical protein